MTEKERAKQLANDHWTGYVQGVVCNHAFENRAYTHEEMLRLCRFHYETAAVHFYGHAIEDERGGMFRPSIGEPLTPAEVNAITRPCRNCHDEDPCGGKKRSLITGDCLYHRPVISDQQHPRKEGP